jgi:hypothetical protein
MIGGKIIQTVRHCDRMQLWVVDTHDASGEAKTGIHDECQVGIYTEDYDAPKAGDAVWWQSGTVYWTPADRRFIDRPLRKAGYSTGVQNVG